MKTTLLSILCIAGFTSFSFGQIEMSVGLSGDISGTQIDYTSAGALVTVDIRITNYTGDLKELSIKRERANGIASWTDYLAWGLPNGWGTSYGPSVMSTNPWTTPDLVAVDVDSVGLLIAYIQPSAAPGCPIYRYTVMDGFTELSYLDIGVCVTADVQDASVKILDVLGNVVLKETVMGSSKSINTESFRNGIYFVVVEAAGSRPITRKIIVRH